MKLEDFQRTLKEITLENNGEFKIISARRDIDGDYYIKEISALFYISFDSGVETIAILTDDKSSEYKLLKEDVEPKISKVNQIKDKKEFN